MDTDMMLRADIELQECTSRLQRRMLGSFLSCWAPHIALNVAVRGAVVDEGVDLRRAAKDLEGKSESHSGI